MTLVADTLTVEVGEVATQTAEEDGVAVEAQGTIGKDAEA